MNCFSVCLSEIYARKRQIYLNSSRNRSNAFPKSNSVNPIKGGESQRKQRKYIAIQKKIKAEVKRFYFMTDKSKLQISRNALYICSCFKQKCFLKWDYQHIRNIIRKCRERNKYLYILLSFYLLF